MKKCPHCGQETSRTKDWACQWCGYPLLSGGYRGIPKTYQELKGERLRRDELPVAEPEVEVVEPGAETVVEAEPEAVPKPKRKAATKRKPRAKSKRETVAEAEVVPEAAPEEMAVTVEELQSAFETDVTEAGDKFADKALRITGVVGRIAINDIIDKPCIILTGADKKVPRNVLCVFDKEYASELNRLTTGQTVTIQGKYDSCTINILITDCVLVG